MQQTVVETADEATITTMFLTGTNVSRTGVGTIESVSLAGTGHVVRVLANEIVTIGKGMTMAERATGIMVIAGEGAAVIDMAMMIVVVQEGDDTY